MALVGIVMLPFYVAALGVEAYGMVGLYVALQGWLALLDFGLSPVLSRQAARFRGGAIAAPELSALLRFVLLVFVIVGTLISIVLAASAVIVVHRWLHNHTLSDADAVGAFHLMAIGLGFRFVAFPLRGFLMGAEDLQWLGLFNAAVTAFRSILVVPAMHLFHATLEVFFWWQLAAGAMEVIVLWLRVRSRMPRDAHSEPIGLHTLQKHWGFSLAIGLTSTIWVAATNADKIILSGLLPLREYAMFSIAAVAAGGVLLLIGPFATALGPRMVRVYAEGNLCELVRRYDQTTQLTAVAAFPAALALAFFARQTLWAWTGNLQIAATGAVVLSLYALGNGLLAIGGLPLQLQIAQGRMGLHVLGTGLFLLLFLPLLWWATKIGGMAGAGFAWLAINFVFVALWVPVAHRHFLPAPHLRWLFGQVFPVLLPTAIAAALLRWLLPWPANRWLTLVELLFVGTGLMAVAVASAADPRRFVIDAFRRTLPEARP